MLDAIQHVLSHVVHGSLREHYLLLFGAAGAIALTTGFVGAWFGARLVTRRAQLDREAADGLRVTPEQVRELSLGIEALALEMERMSEGQRFVAKVLVERQPSALPSPRREPGVITPH